MTGCFSIGYSSFVVIEGARMHDRIPPQMGPMYGPQAQRYRDYTRMRQMSTDDLLMENRIIFLGSSRDRKSTRLNSSHANISYAVFCLKKKKRNHKHTPRQA